jgi:hypothetical protein
VPDTSIIPGMRAPAEPAQPSRQELPAAAKVLAALAAMRTRAGRQFRVLRKKEGGLIHGLLHAKPRSVAEQIAYAKDRKWLPADCDDGRFDRAGAWYHRWIGVPGVALAAAYAAVFSQPFFLAYAALPYAVVSAFWTLVLAGEFGVSILPALVAGPAMVFAAGNAVVFAAAVVLAKEEIQ